MPAVVIPRILRDTFGDEVSEALVDFFNQLTDHSRDETITLVEEKFERRLTEEFARLRSEDLARLDRRITEETSALRQEIVETSAYLREEIAGVKSELREEIVSLKSDLRVEMANHRADLIRWMFIFWVGQLGAILAIMFVFFK